MPSLVGSEMCIRDRHKALCTEYAQSTMPKADALAMLDTTMRAMGLDPKKPGTGTGRTDANGDSIGGDLLGDEDLDALEASGVDYDDGTTVGGVQQPAQNSTAHRGRGTGEFRDMSQVAGNPKLLKKNATAAGNRIAQKMSTGATVVSINNGER